MNAQIKQFSESLRLKLGQIQTQLNDVKSDLKTIQKADTAALQSRMSSARHSVEDGMHHVKDAEVKTKAWLKAKEEAGEAVIQGWKDKHESRKLEHHAERAEANADAALCLAAGAISNAVLAAYEAIDARMAASQTVAA